MPRSRPDPAVAQKSLDTSIAGATIRRLPWSHSTRLAVLAVVIVVAGVGISLVARSAIIQNYRESEERALEIETTSLNLEITTRLDSYVNALERMASRWSFQLGTPREAWEADAMAYLADMAGTHALGWWTADGDLRWVMPKTDRNLAPLLLTQSRPQPANRPTSSPGASAATELRSLALTGGHTGFLVFVPLYRTTFDGYLVTLSLADELFPPLLREASVHGFDAAIYDADGRLIFPDDPPPPCRGDCQRRVSPFQIRTLPYSLHVWTRPERNGAASWWIANVVLGAGLVFSALLALALVSADRAREETHLTKKASRALHVEIAEHRRTQASLHAAQAQYVDLYNHSPDMQLSLDTSGTVLQCNQTCAVALGRTREDLIGTPVEQHLLFEDRNAVRAISAMLGPDRRRVDDISLRLLPVSGPVLEVSANAILADDVNRGGHPVIRVTLRDVTEQRRLQRLETTNQELLRSNSDLEQFAYAASHDLREPLRMVSSYATLLHQRYGGQLDKRADKYIAYMVEGADRMQDLIADLLAYSRLGTRPKTRVRFNAREPLDEAVHNLEISVQECSGMITCKTLPDLAGDRSQFVQLFQNLLGNALKYRRDEQPPDIHVAADREGDEWVFSIQDNGIGIAPEHTERIFGIFKRLHERGKYPGNGVGLALCKKIVEHHGGRIWVEAATTGGSVFRFTVPASVSVPASATAA